MGIDPMVSRSEIGTPTQRGLLRDCTTGCGTDGSIFGTNNYVPFSDPWLRCPRWAERCQWRRHLLSLPGFLLLITLAPAPAQRGHPQLQTITAALQHICTTHHRRSCGQNIIGSLLVSKWLSALYRKKAHLWLWSPYCP